MPQCTMSHKQSSHSILENKRKKGRPERGKKLPSLAYHMMLAFCLPSGGAKQLNLRDIAFWFQEKPEKREGGCLTAVSYTHLTLPTTPYV